VLEMTKPAVFSFFEPIKIYYRRLSKNEQSVVSLSVLSHDP